MGCNISKEQLWSWVDREAPELGVHLTDCAHCRARAGKIREEIRLIADDASVLDLPLPDYIGPYRVKRLLGEGGQALVFEAEQASPKRLVAVKVLKGGRFASKLRIKHFQREMQSLACLRHPAIATIFDAGRTEEGLHYFAMELVEGMALHAHVHQHNLAPGDCLALFQKICEAVDYAHQHGIIHRDLKPSNLWIDARGDPKILDFGLARITGIDVELATTLTKSGIVEGTPRYMSPEQARGQPEEIDARTDVYSLGVVLYELLTNQPPYEIHCMTPEALRTICEDAPRSPKTINRNLSGSLEAIILKALEKEPARRYASALALAQDIHRYRKGERVHARHKRPRVRLRFTLSKQRVAAALVVLALALFGLAFWRANRPVYDLQQARTSLLEIRQTLLDGNDMRLAYARARVAHNRFVGLPEASLLMAQAQYLNAEQHPAILHLESELELDPSEESYRILLDEMRRTTHPAAAAPLEEDSGDWETWYLRSFASLDKQRALEWARRAAGLAPANLLLVENVTRLCYLTGDMEGALDGVTTLLQAGAAEAKWSRYRGDVLVALRRYPEAIEEFDRYVTLFPCSGGAYSLRAAVHRRMRHYEAAIADYGNAIECYENSRRAAWVYYHRGTPAWIRGEREQAAADYGKAYELLTFPTYANARLYLVLHELRRQAEAQQMLAESRTRIRNNPWLATIFACLGNDLTPLELVDAADPNIPQQVCEAFYYAGETCLIQGKMDEARVWFQKCKDTGTVSDPLNRLDPMSEYELTEWRLRQLASRAE